MPLKIHKTKRAGHPSWIDMIKECITHQADPSRRGVSRHQIKKYVGDAYHIRSGQDQNIQLSKAIVLGEWNGIFIRPKGPRGRVELAPKPLSTGASTNKKLELPCLSDLKFKRQKGAFDISKAKGFTSLLETIRGHLLQSKSTRAIYVTMAKEFYVSTTNDVRALCSEPTDNDFLSYVHSNWPTFKSSFDVEEENSLTWGWVLKQETQIRNEIHILSSLVRAAEVAPTLIHRPLDKELYHIILTAIILHELAHAFTKFYFYDNFTPIGVGIGEQRDCGESGWFVEERLMGGHLQVEWADKKSFGDMLRIDNVLLVNGPKCWEINADVARTSLSSLRRKNFVQPLKKEMKTHCPSAGSRRARYYSETTRKPRTVLEPCQGLGLGLSSFIGVDRR